MLTVLLLVMVANASAIESTFIQRISPIGHDESNNAWTASDYQGELGLVLSCAKRSKPISSKGNSRPTFVVESDRVEETVDCGSGRDGCKNPTQTAFCLSGVAVG